ncbi:M15 family metallopeptidase [Promicromonospora iranensis]|uniref:M15 family metallopeptidase n=1 Tax=Promicromonospora iranensis TaxID=1105144 RepID=UPI0023AA1621|nr:M15 family metallopeptidase [Promicromonospora iranensis]
MTEGQSTQPTDGHRPGAAFLRDQGVRLRRAARSRYARNAWTGAVALAVTGGVLVSASASVPTSDTTTSGPASSSAAGTTASDAGHSPARASGSSQDESETGTAGVTVGQVLAVLDRAERQLRQSSAVRPHVAQAAAELGMLYTTYQAQQLALAEADEPLRVETAPTAGKVRAPAPDDGAASATRVSRVVTEEPGHGPGDAPAHTHGGGQASGYVTFDEVAVAAMRLANMLDPTSPTALVETLPSTEPSLRRSLLETVAAYGDSTAGYANGRIPADVLCPLPFAAGHLLRCDAAERLIALDERFEREFGYPIPLTDSYRSYATQVAVRGTKPHLAAIPGTSNHGWGLAIDLGDPLAGGSSPEYVWLRLHAPDYGWDNPSWARLGGAKPEPWHFEFFAAGSIPNRAIDPSDVGTWVSAAPASPDDADRPAALPASARTPGAGNAPSGRADVPADGGDAPRDGAGGSGRAPASGDSSAPKPTDPPPPARPAPSKPAPSDPPTEEPGAPVDPDTGVVGAVVEGTVELVDGTLGGVVGGLLGAG